MNRKFKVLVMGVACLAMLLVAKSHANDFRLGIFKEHVTLRLDQNMEDLLKETSSIRWFSDENILEKEYMVEFNYEEKINTLHLEFLSIKEFKQFQKKEGPIRVEFRGNQHQVLFEIDVYASKRRDENTGRNGFQYDFIYKDNTRIETVKD